jgi:hypothetical protein
MNTGVRFLLIGCLVIGGFSAAAAAAGPDPLVAPVSVVAPDPLFAQEAVLAVTLTAPLDAMAKDRNPDPEYLPGTLSYQDAQGRNVQLDMKVRPRGNSRRERRVCTFPPLRLNFQKKQVKDTLFAGQNALKLVTHCRWTEKFQQYVLKEYLAYRMLNVLTDASFRVRLLQITYVDSERDSKPYQRYGFFIEHKNRLAERLNTEVAEPVAISPQQLDPAQASIASLFQFMISNTDYSFIAAPPDETCCHNAILLKGPEASFLPVPYDFDRSGLVDPPNGLPDENLGQKNLRDRLYRGFCRPEPYLSQSLEETRSRRSQLEGLAAQQQDLTDRTRRDVLKYLASFYRIIDDARLRERNLKCRNPL